MICRIKVIITNMLYNNRLLDIRLLLLSISVYSTIEFDAIFILIYSVTLIKDGPSCSCHLFRHDTWISASGKIYYRKYVTLQSIFFLSINNWTSYRQWIQKKNPNLIQNSNQSVFEKIISFKILLGKLLINNFLIFN